MYEELKPVQPLWPVGICVYISLLTVKQLNLGIVDILRIQGALLMNDLLLFYLYPHFFFYLSSSRIYFVRVEENDEWTISLQILVIAQH